MNRLSQLKNYSDDIFFWLGAILITIGAYCIYPAAAFFSAGIFCLTASYLFGRAKANNQ
jgi:hypothetical protein